MTSLQDLQQLYDAHRFMDAFQQSAHYWQPSTSLNDLSLDELILGGRLAFRLGGWRLSRHLFRAAYDRDPSNSSARYFSRHVLRRKAQMIDELRAIESDPELSAEPPGMRANWLASHAVTWATLRDFATAHLYIERARTLDGKDAWIATCESSIYGFEDRWEQALRCGEQAWALSPGVPHAAQSLASALLNLGRVQDAAEWLASAAEGSQSYEVVHLACWYHCALAETMEGDQRHRVLSRACEHAGRLPVLLPLADRDSRAFLARTQLDIAELADDREQIERWAKDIPSPFYRIVLQNLRKNTGRSRKRLPLTRAVQKHDACLPTSLASALSTMGVKMDPDSMAREITFGGTTEWAAADWLEKHGMIVRCFPVTWDLAMRLLKRGIGFVMTLEADDSAHAVAVVGMDEAAETLLIHDPREFRTTEYLVDGFRKETEPFGIKGMVAVPPEKAPILEELLPPAGVRIVTAAHRHFKAVTLHGPSAARDIVREVSAQLPCHPGTRLLMALQAAEDGRIGEALLRYQELLKEFPESSFVRARLVNTCRSLGNMALARKALADVVQRGVLPGTNSCQPWLYPPARYVAEYADLLRLSADSREQAAFLLHALIRRDWTSAEAWHNLADLLHNERDSGAALLAYRLASCLASNNEHYALAYAYALCQAHQEEAGFAWLSDRVRRFGAMPLAAGAWISWICALEEWGYPERALSACTEAMREQPGSAELLAFASPFFARMGRWQEAEELLSRLQNAANLPLFHQAAVEFSRMRGDLQKYVHHAESWSREMPRDMSARYAWLDAVAKRDGSRAAARLASAWHAENPGHDDLEAALYDRSEGPSSDLRKYSILLRRVKRNPEDSWAWRELAFRYISDYELGDERRRTRLRGRVVNVLAQCHRTAPDDAIAYRARARWHEACAQWQEAIDDYLQAIVREPAHPYSYSRIWDCSASFDAVRRQQVWDQMEPLFLLCPGHLALASELSKLLAQRFGVSFAEQTLLRWKELRPEDPEVTQALVDLLIEHGHGRTDAARALDLLLPAVEHYPYHVGLRFSLGSAYRRLGDFSKAEEVLRETHRRHPGNPHGIVQLASVLERHGKGQDAFQWLEAASSENPLNTQIHESLVQFLIRAGRFEEARARITEALRRVPEDVNWRTQTINLLLDCGDEEGSIAVAREGVRIYPRGAYLWYLLGTTLLRLPRFADPGEIESCFRRCLSLNALYFDAADQLAILLLDQRRYEEAASVMNRILPKMADPSPAKGRLAWIHRQQERSSDAREEMTVTVSQAPWYFWGWSVLMDWIAEDKAWGQARSLLAQVTPELRTSTQFRWRRLLLMGRAGLPANERDAEWDALLQDFPEEVSLHLNRYDILREDLRLPEARAVLHAIRPVEPDNPFMLARYVEVLTAEKQTAPALCVLQSLFFAEAESSPWPVDYAWQAIKQAKLEEKAFQEARLALEKGSRPTVRAFFILCANALERGATKVSFPQPTLRIWFPDRGARELLKLLSLAERAPWMDCRYRAVAYEQLSNAGYSALVLKESKKLSMATSDVATWAQVGRALAAVGRKADARSLLGSWRTRPGVCMWMVANYVESFSPFRREHLTKVAADCREALAVLPHDHCARYLAHVHAEACALLGDKQAFRETWDLYRPYFDGRILENEWFSIWRRHLLEDIPKLAACLDRQRLGLFRLKAWALRWKNISFLLHR